MKRQLWFWVLVAIAAGIAVRPGRPWSGHRLEVARGRVPAAHQDGHRAGDLRHGRDRHRLAGRHGPRRWSGAARARLLPRGHRARADARADRGQSGAAGLRVRRLGRGGGHRGRQGEDRRGHQQRERPDRLHHRGPAPDELRPAVRGERDPARAGHRDPRRRRHLRARAASARAGRGGVRGDLEDPLRDHPHDHVGGAAGRVRRHGLHGRPVRRRRAHEPRAADGHLLGHLRRLRLRRARPGRALERLQHLQVRAAAEGRAADHRRHLVLGDRAAAAAVQAAEGGRLQADRRRRAPDGLLVQPRRHLHLPHARRAVHHPGGRPVDVRSASRSRCAR